jgi:hypothetical protein
MGHECGKGDNKKSDSCLFLGFWVCMSLTHTWSNIDIAKDGEKSVVPDSNVTQRCSTPHTGMCTNKLHHYNSYAEQPRVLP